MKAALAGTLVLVIGVLLLAWIIPDSEVRHPMWVFVFFLLAVCAVFFWRHPKAPKNASEWTYCIGGAFLIGSILVLIDGIIFGMHSVHVILDISLSVLGAIVAASGFARSLVKEKEQSE